MHLYYSGLKILLVSIVFALSAFAAQDTGLVAEYHLDRYGSTQIGGHYAFDSSGNNFTATLSVVEVFNDTGRFGKALVFDGTCPQSCVSITHNALFKPATEITIEAYVFPYINNTLKEIWRKEDGGDRSLLSFQNTGACASSQACLAFGISIGGSYVELEADANNLNGSWHHVVATYNGSNKSIWIDGTLRASILVSGAIGTTGSATAYIGSYSGSTEVFTGMIDELRFYNRSLSPAEIQKHYNCDYYKGNTGNWNIGNKSVWCRGVVTVTGNVTAFANSTLNFTQGEFNISQGLTVPETGATVNFGYTDINAGWFFLDAANSNVTAPLPGEFWQGFSDSYTTNRMVLNSETGNRNFRVSNGIFLHNGGTIEFRDPDQVGWQAANTALNNLVINATAGSFDFVSNSVYLAGNLTIADGTLRIANNQGNLNLVVNGTTFMEGGNLYSQSDTGNADIGFNFSGGLFMYGASSYNGGTRNHVFKSFYSETSGTVVQSNGITEISGEGYMAVYHGEMTNFSDYAYTDYGSPIALHNNGTLNFSLRNVDSNNYSYIDDDVTLYLNNIILNSTSNKVLCLVSPDLSLAGNLSVLSGTFCTNGGQGDKVVTVNGTTNVSGIFGNNSAWTFNQNGVLTISAGGTFNAPNETGSWTYGNAIIGNGIMNPNGGQATVNGGAGLHIRISGSNVTFNNITTGVTGFITVVADSTGGGTTNVLVTGNLVAVGASSTRLVESVTGSITKLTLGTATSSGKISSGAASILLNGGTSIIQAASPSYPWQMDQQLDLGTYPGSLNLTNGNLTSVTATSGAGTNYNIVNMTFNGAVTVTSSDNWVYGGMITHLGAMTANTGSTLNSSFANITITGTFNISSTRSTMNDSTINAFGPFYICGTGNITFTNVTMTNATPTVGCSANFTVRWRDVQVTDENGAVVSSALTNVTQGGSVISSGTTDSGGKLPAIITDYQNVGGTFTFSTAILSGSKSGYSSNTVTDNVTRSNYQLALAPNGGGSSGFSTGFSVDGTPLSTTFTPIVKVNNLAVRGPWQNMQNVTIIDNATGAVVANFTHNFSLTSLPVRYLKINHDANWVGISTRDMAVLGRLNYSYSLNVPVKDAVCNTQACTGDNKLVIANCDSPDWVNTVSTKSGSVCLASVRGTVVRDQADLTSIVAVPDLSFIWVLIIFVISVAIFSRFKND